MTENEAQRLETYLRRWRATYPYRWQQGAEVVANDLKADIAFTDIKVAALLESPGGVTITQVVQRVLPFPEDTEFAVMVKAIEIAASQRTTSQLLAVLVGGAIAAFVIWALFGGS